MHGQQAHQMLLSSMTDAGEQRTKAFGRIGLTFGISFLFVPMISTGCGRLFVSDERAALLAAIVITIIAIAIMLIYLSHHIPSVMFTAFRICR